MNKKAVFAVILMAAIIALLAWWLWPAAEYYSDDPKTWVDKKPGNVIEVNVDKVTKGQGFLDPVGLQWNDGKVITAFGYDGMYHGNVFDDVYADPETEKNIMAITSAMTPGDGVIEGFIIERLQGSKVLAFIFVDDDWKRAIGFGTNIVWGAQYDKVNPFTFNEISPGIYMDSVEDDPGRFSDNFQFHTGGVAVGNVRPENIKAKQQAGITVIRMF